MFISPAYAQGTGGPGGFDIMTLVPLILIFVVFYFLLIRPQQKKVKEHREMLGKLRRGDRIVTNGGLIGKIMKVVNENELDLEIADGVRVRVMRGMISSVYARTEEADDEKPANENK
jgi:preprotein translocase subunit YajC